MHTNFKNIDKIVFGAGSINDLSAIIENKRALNDGFMVYVIDHFFTDNTDFFSALGVQAQDVVRYINVDVKEPTTEMIDQLRDSILNQNGLPAGIIGIGGGSIMDIAKAAALMFTNPGSSTLYQGLNLVKKPGIYHCGIPTISGTGAECSMTAVLSGPDKNWD